MESIVQARGLVKSYGTGDTRQTVLHDLCLEVGKGEFCVLLGPSGSGKSTLLNIIGGIDLADAGDIAIAGETLSAKSEKAMTEYRRNHLGYVFQSYNLIPDLSVRENIETGAWLSASPLDVDEILETLGLKEHQHKRPSQLSGGQQQRTAIGRAVVKNPDLLLADEPTGALDYESSKQILRLLEKVNETYGTTIVMVTHNEALAAMADHVIRLRDGRIRQDKSGLTRRSVMDLEW